MPESFNDKASASFVEDVNADRKASASAPKLDTLAELDEAAIVLQTAGDVEFGLEENIRVLRLIDFWVLSRSICLLL
jgi:hypothetical protein